MRTVNELMETITIKVTSWTKFLEGILLYSSEFLLHFANVILHMLSFSTSYLQKLDLQYQYWATHGPKVQQKQPASSLEWDAEEQQVPPSSPKPASHLLTGSDVGRRGHNENWSLDSMLTARMQTSEASTTTFKDDTLEVAVILCWMKTVCVNFWKFMIMNGQKI